MIFPWSCRCPWWPISHNRVFCTQERKTHRVGGDKNISKGNAKQLSVGSTPHPQDASGKWFFFSSGLPILNKTCHPGGDDCIDCIPGPRVMIKQLSGYSICRISQHLFKQRFLWRFLDPKPPALGFSLIFLVVKWFPDLISNQFLMCWHLFGAGDDPSNPTKHKKTVLRLSPTWWNIRGI